MTMPDNMRAWLTAYSEELRQMEAEGMKPSRRAQQTRPAKNAIKPMLVTQWDQGNPYNAMCPMVKGKRSYTGCTITATAQVLYYYKWPASTTGIVNVNMNGNGDGNWYDLQGRRVNSSNLHSSPFTVKKGIYIVNGKKIIR